MTFIFLESNLDGYKRNNKDDECNEEKIKCIGDKVQVSFCILSFFNDDLCCIDKENAHWKNWEGWNFNVIFFWSVDFTYDNNSD